MPSTEQRNGMLAALALGGFGLGLMAFAKSDFVRSGKLAKLFDDFAKAPSFTNESGTEEFTEAEVLESKPLGESDADTLKMNIRIKTSLSKLNEFGKA